MIKYILCILSIVTINSYAESDFDAKFSGNIDAQAKKLANPNTADDLGQVWENRREDQVMVYGNVDAKLTLFKNAVEANWFFRYGQSEIFQDEDLVASNYSLYPKNIISRDIFKLEFTEENTSTRTESIINKLSYSWGDEEASFTVGRMFIEFGEGYSFNPINPFALPLVFSSQKNIKQGNDGVKYLLSSDPKLRIHLYLLGDKQFTEYDGQITRTIFLRGDWDYSDQLHINYIIGEDQKRHKYGLEAKYSFHQGVAFAQAIKNSQRLDKQSGAAQGLFHYIFGYEKDLTDSWTARLEFGKQDSDSNYPEGDYAQNFLPQKSFISIINKYQATEKVKLTLNNSIDPKSGFSYALLDANYQVYKRLQFHGFFAGTIARAKDEVEYEAQRLLPAELGFGIRSIF